MAYKIQYGYSKRDNSQNRAVLRRMVLLVSTVLLVLAGLHLTDVLLPALLPGDPVVTAAAVDSLLDNLQDGRSFGDALRAFCREILDGAALAE